MFIKNKILIISKSWRIFDKQNLRPYVEISWVIYMMIDTFLQVDVIF